jgi:alanine transaminase
MASTTVLSIDTINPHVRAAEYAVRGVIPQRAEQYRAQLAKGEGKDLPFDNVIFANIGNPQQLDQKPITFFRQVVSLLEWPELLEKEDALIGSLGYKKDAVERARTLLKEVKSVGAYSNSAGAPGIKQSVANFIERELFISTLSVLDLNKKFSTTRDVGTAWAAPTCLGIDHILQPCPQPHRLFCQ